MSRRSPRSSWRARAALATLTSVVVGIAAVGGVAPIAAAIDTPTAESAPPAGPEATHLVTLITGDTVQVTDLSDGTHAVQIDTAIPGAGVRTYEAGGDLHVLPQSAMPYVATGSLDPDLFNVSLLIRDGYDDASVDATPIIAVLSDEPTARGAGPDLQLGQPLTSIGGAAGAASHDTSADIWTALTEPHSDARSFGAEPRLADGISSIHLDGKVHATLDSTVPYIGAPEAWEQGYTGEGATVAVLDTGYDDTHPDLAGRVLADASTSFVPGEEVAVDTQGHGTHVASTIAGTGAASDGTHRGVADGADLLIGKVLGADGSGQDSWIIAGMQWAGENADIVSMSLGSQQPSDGTDLMATALDEISAATGALFVVAAGNSAAPETIGSPGSAASALTIGSVDDPTGTLSWFSSQGPLARSGALKPDLTGPGNEVTAARSADSPGEGAYVTMSGTSMATPHVAGAAAIVKQQHPEYTAAQLRAALVSTAMDVDLTSYQGGTGVVDVAGAVESPVLASGSGDFGMLAWGEEPELETRTIDYTNRGEAEITVTLTAALTSTAEVDGPASEAFSMDVDSLTIPAGETRSVTLSVDPSKVPAGTQLAGMLLGSVDGTPITRTALGTIAELERYDLTITAKDFGGEPTDAYVMINQVETGLFEAVPVSGDYTLRLPGGHYSVMSYIDLPTAPDSMATVLVGDPDLVLESDATVDLDARTAEKITVDVGKSGLQSVFRRMDYQADGFSSSALAADWIDDLYAQPMSAPNAESFDFTTRWRLQQPTLTLTAAKEQLDVIPLAGATALNGKLSAQAVDAGLGSVADFAGVDVKGKVAVVTRSAEVSGTERAANALAAGAALLVVANDVDAEFTDWVGAEDGTEVALPVAGISGVQGRALLDRIAAGKVTMTGVGIPNSPETYDISRYSSMEIPADLAFKPGKLARIDVRYYGQPTLIGEMRYDFTPRMTYGSAFPLRATSGTTRAEYVNTEQVGWYQDVMVVEAQWFLRDMLRTYKPGQKVTTSYLGGIVRPYVGPGYWAPFRAGDNAQVNVPSWADGGDAMHTGAMDVYSGLADRAQLTDVYIDGTQVSSSPYQSANVDGIPDAAAHWRVVNTATQSSAFLPSSTRTVTDWGFTSAGSTDYYAAQILPMIQASYDVALDDAGIAGSGRLKGLPLRLGLELGHIGGAVGAAKMTEATLEVRVEGGEWRSALLLRTSRSTGPGADPVDGFSTDRSFVTGYTGLVPVPNAGGWIDLRVTAKDAAGNTVTQEIERGLQIAPAKSWWHGGGHWAIPRAS